MLKKANMQWTGKTLFNQVEKQQIIFDCAIQRNPCWDIQRKSLLIHSMIEGYPIPALFFSKRSDKKYDALDGKQRSITISEYFREEFSLSENTPAIWDEEGIPIEVSGKKFSELPEWAQDNIKDYSLTIYYFEDLTEDEKSELFFRINNGKSLTSIELTRVKAKCLKEFQKIAAHELIRSSVTDTGKKRYTNENIAMQSWMLCFSETKDFSTKVFRPAIESADVTEEQVGEIEAAMNYVLKVCNSMDSSDKEQKRVLKKIKTRSHLVSCIYLAKKFIEAGIDIDKFKETVYNFFNCSKTSTNDKYNDSVGVSSAKPEKVRVRIAVMDSLLSKYLVTESRVTQTITENQDEKPAKIDEEISK